jgi:alkylated DNA repair protein (DNA oxidative demethylase)
VPGWLSDEERRYLVAAVEQWAQPPAPMRHIRMRSGGVMSVQTVCLGWHWTPYRYTRTAIDTDNTPVEPVPAWLADVGRRAVADAYDGPGAEAAPRYEPDTALINLYDADAKMGLHQDKDEVSLAPVVSLSIGASCIFRFGNTETRGRPYTDVQLDSGDLVVFGGPSRLAYHGITKVLAGTGDAAAGLPEGHRLNVTLRETGLRAAPSAEGP